MLFDSFSRPEEWDSINFRLKKDLASANQIRCYINPYLATHDLLISLAQLYAHKRSVAWVCGVSPLLENSQPFFVRESYQIQTLKIEEFINAPDQGQSTIEKLNKDTLFLVFFKNHAVSGEAFPYEKVEEWATAKKIVFILISHEFEASFKIGTTSMGLQVVCPELSLVFLPERSKLNSSLGAYQNIEWQDSWASRFQSVVHPLEELIKSWEASLPLAKWVYSSARPWNRSVLIFENIHSELIVEKLRQKGFQKVKSFSDCVSNSPRSIRKWIVPELSDETLRGLIVLSFDEPKDIPSASLIQEIVQSIKAESEWTY